MVITFDHVTKIYEGIQQQVTALDDVNLHIDKGEIYGVIGFSGAGKAH